MIPFDCHRERSAYTHTHIRAYRNTHSWQALRPLCISSGEDLHAAPGRSTDKLPRQRRETESLAAGERLCSENASSVRRSPKSPRLTPRFPQAGAYRGARTGKDYLLESRRAWRPRLDLPSLGPQEGLGGQCPPRARLRPAAPRLSFTNQAPFSPNQRCRLGGKWSKVLLSALNNSPTRNISSHKRTV